MNYFLTTLALALGLTNVAMAEDARVSVELNKFETSDEGICRAFFLFRNGTEASFESFEMSLVVIDQNGIIDRLLSIDAAPLPVARTTLKLFEIPEIACTEIAELIVHDIPACKPQNADPVDCYALIDWVSRTGARLGP